MDLLAVLKALGDETRFSMYQELAGSTSPLTATELAERLGLHANTVRLASRTAARGRSGRRRGGPPGHRRPAPARLFAGAGCTRPRFRPAELHAARRPARLAGRAGRRRCRGRDGRGPGLGRRSRPPHPLAFVREGADRRDAPARLRPRDRDLPGRPTDIAFLHCPFRELAEAYPELVCNLHRGISEGVVDDGRRGKQSRSSRRCTTVTRAG